MNDALQTLDFCKYPNQVIPAIVQDYNTQKILTMGFMNEEALHQTETTGVVTFYNRAENKLWSKGAEGGHQLQLRQILVDCDKDTLLIKAIPTGPVCHTGGDTCWSEKNSKEDFLYYLEHLIELRRKGTDEGSYVKQLFAGSPEALEDIFLDKAAQLAKGTKDVKRALFLDTAADVLFHYLVLLQVKDCSLTEVVTILQQRHQPK